MRILDLFSGTGSIARTAEELGYEVISLDISNTHHTPTIQTNILDWDYKVYPKGYFDVIWASPPCNTFSIINRLNYKEDEWKQRIETIGLPLLRKTEEIIDYFEPPLWIIENPQGKMKQYIEGRPMYTVDYCQYADFGYRKRTTIWTNHPKFQPLVCQRNCSSMVGRRHRIQLSWNKTSLKERFRVPKKLIEILIS